MLSLTARLRQSLAEVRFAPESADKIVGGREPAEVGHSLQVPDEDAWLHAGRSVAQRLGIEKDVLRYSEPGYALNPCLFDNLVGALLELHRHVEAKRLGGLEVDH